MASMIIVNTTLVVVYVQAQLKLPVVFAEIRPPKPKNINPICACFPVVFGFSSVSVSVYM